MIPASRLRKSVSASSSGSTLWTYTWDFENRLAQVHYTGGGLGTTNFKYDPFGRRVQKSSASTTNYIYDGANILEELDGSGNLLARYTQGAGVDEPLAMLRGGATYYYEADGLGSITSLTDSTGAIKNTYVYNAFGGGQGGSGTVTNPFQFTGREYDSETGLYYYRARYYDPSVGRFLSEDPIRMNGGINFYSYVKNRPATFSDPTGTCMLQFDSLTGTLGKCKLDPNGDRQCACLCSISPEYQKCIKDCKDGCLSSSLSAVESCQCLCNKGRENGSLNNLEAWLCKKFCKKAGK